MYFFHYETAIDFLIIHSLEFFFLWTVNKSGIISHLRFCIIVSEPCVQNNKLILISEENNYHKDFRIFFKLIFIANSGSNM